jgi:hypothetical protein
MATSVYGSEEAQWTWNAQPANPKIAQEWLLWVAENHLAGVPNEQIAGTLLECGYDHSTVTSVLGGLQSEAYQLLAERSLRRWKKLKSLLEIRKSLASLSHGAGGIERRSSVCRSEFLERYYVTNRPVILTGMLTDSFAYQYWTPQHLAQTCGEVLVQVMAGRESDPRYEINCDGHRFSIRLAEYVEMVLSGGATNDYYLVANNGFFAREETRTLFEQVPQFPEYLDHSQAQQKTFLWFGPAGTITPLHHDIMNIFVAQVFGRKRFTLIRPEDTPYVYNEVGVFGDVDCRNPDYGRHPLYAQATPIDVILEPGDLLFLPVGWWHYVEALEACIMLSYINFWFPNEYQWENP